MLPAASSDCSSTQLCTVGREMFAATIGAYCVSNAFGPVLRSLLATIEERIVADANGSREGNTEAAGNWAVKSQPHIPLLQRAKEPSMQERLQKLGRTTLGQ
jgi:hypothetical protein